MLKRLGALPVSDVCISVITKSELLFGVEVSPRRRQQDEAALDAFLHYIEVLDFPGQASLHYARIRADLRRQGAAVGAKIGANDLFIAAHAAQPGPNAGYQQHARVWASLQVGDRKLDTLARREPRPRAECAWMSRPHLSSSRAPYPGARPCPWNGRSMRV